MVAPFVLSVTRQCALPGVTRHIGATSHGKRGGRDTTRHRGAGRSLHPTDGGVHRPEGHNGERQHERAVTCDRAVHAGWRARAACKVDRDDATRGYVRQHTADDADAVATEASVAGRERWVIKTQRDLPAERRGSRRAGGGSGSRCCGRRGSRSRGRRRRAHHRLARDPLSLKALVDIAIALAHLARTAGHQERRERGGGEQQAALASWGDHLHIPSSRRDSTENGGFILVSSEACNRIPHTRVP